MVRRNKQATILRPLTKRGLALPLFLALGLYPAATILGPVLHVQAAAYPGSQQDGAALLSSQFTCPETFSSDEAKRQDVGRFIKSYSVTFPQNNLRDMMIMRYRLLVTHSCTETLKSMVSSVTPIWQMLRFDEDDLGPKTEEYDPDTEVWTARFTKDGEPASLSSEELIFNFYPPGALPGGIASAFVSPRVNMTVIFSFQSPDELTGRPAFFIFSANRYPGEASGYVDITKISSTGGKTYAVNLERKVSDGSKDNTVRAAATWLSSTEGKAATDRLGKVGVDPSWYDYLARKAK